MGARGFNVADEGHVVQLLAAENVSGGVSSQIFSMRGAAKCNILVGFGAESAAEGLMQLFAATDNTGATKVAIPYDLYKQETSGLNNDVLSGRVAVPATGYQLPGTAFTFYVLHIQADQLPQGYPELQLVIADGTNTDYAAAFAVLSGVRFQGVSNQTAIV